ncbi:hypothetical protein AB8A05_04145 [Tardiphaga sp. 538_B7_N1_4]|uniref:hypothetical protein n=1 Tax=Tardiphaga sp. 538_B7_N1_4 TaxID=3240778 RepID=UPI003F1E87C2
MQESDQQALVEKLQVSTAMSRLTVVEITNALAFMQNAGYEVKAPKVYEEQTYKLAEPEKADVEGATIVPPKTTKAKARK